jgi:hypothetical protein
MRRLDVPSGGDVMSQGNWGGGGAGDGRGGGSPPGGGYGQPPGGAPPGGYGPPPGGYGPPPGGYGAPPGGYGGPPGGGGFAPPPAGYPPGYNPQSTVGPVAWDDSSKGIIGGGWETFKDACFTPKTFFAGVAQNDNPWPSITFGMATGGLAGFLYGIFAALIYLAIGGMVAAAAGTGSRGMGAGGTGMLLGFIGAMGLLVVIVYPLILAMLSLTLPWIFGGVYHLMLMLMKGATKPYTNTVRVSGYSNAATLWLVIPGIGGLVAIGFHLVLTVIGLDETHKCGTGKAVAAVLIPMVLFCGCCCVGYATLFAMISSSKSMIF